MVRALGACALHPLRRSWGNFQRRGSRVKTQERAWHVAQAQHYARRFVGAKGWAWPGGAGARAAWRVGAPAQSLFLRRQPWLGKRTRYSGRFTRTGRTGNTLRSSPVASRRLRTFSTRSVRGRAGGGGMEGGFWGSLAGALRDFEGALSGSPRLLLLFVSFSGPTSSSLLDPQAPLGSPCKVILLQAELFGLIAITPDPLTSPFSRHIRQLHPPSVVFHLFDVLASFVLSFPSSFPALHSECAFQNASLNRAVLLYCLKTLDWALSPSESSRNPVTPCFLVPTSPLFLFIPSCLPFCYDDSRRRWGQR